MSGHGELYVVVGHDANVRLLKGEAAVGAQVYAVNEDGDKPEKREFCRARGLEYLVLRRVPAAGLQRRSSTDLRGF